MLITEISAGEPISIIYKIDVFIFTVSHYIHTKELGFHFEGNIEKRNSNSQIGQL